MKSRIEAFTRAVLAIALFAPLPVAAQNSSDIYVAPLSGVAAALRVGVPANVSAFPGYDNHPSFSPDGRSLYFVSGRASGEQFQGDVFRYDSASGVLTRITATLEGEFSPTVTPDGRLSANRQQLDGVIRLWSFDLDGGSPRVVLDSIWNVGYHTWLNVDTVFVTRFTAGPPIKLLRVDVRKQRADVVADSIGPVVVRMPGTRMITFAQGRIGSEWVRKLDPVSGVVESIAPLPDGTRYFAWTPDGTLLSTRGNQLVRWENGAGRWETIATFNEPGLQSMTRLAVSPLGDRIALVGHDQPLSKP